MEQRAKELYRQLNPEPAAEPAWCGKADRAEAIDEVALLRKRIRELETAAAKPAAEPVEGRAEWSGVKCRKCPGWFCL